MAYNQDRILYGTYWFLWEIPWGICRDISVANLWEYLLGENWGDIWWHSIQWNLFQHNDMSSKMKWFPKLVKLFVFNQETTGFLRGSPFTVWLLATKTLPSSHIFQQLFCRFLPFLQGPLIPETMARMLVHLGTGIHYIHSHVYIYIYIHLITTYISNYVYVYIYTYICIYIHVYVNVNVNVSVNVNAYAYVYVNAKVYAYVNVYT